MVLIKFYLDLTMVYDIRKVKDGTGYSKTYLSQPLIHMSQRQV